MNISFLKDKGNKYLILILLGVLILVVFLPTGSSTSPALSEKLEESEADLEGQLKRVLSAMEGVGDVEVMITTDSTNDRLFGETGEGGKVCGVVVVAEGAGIPSVNEKISEAVKALFSVDAHKISIVKMRSQEGDR